MPYFLIQTPSSLEIVEGINLDGNHQISGAIGLASASIFVSG
jgi:hypothetical protein